MAGKMKTLEQRFARLQEIIAKLEQGSLSLDESIEVYAEGMKLTASCRETLSEMTAKVKAAREQALGFNAADKTQAVDPLSPQEPDFAKNTGSAEAPDGPAAG